MRRLCSQKSVFLLAFFVSVFFSLLFTLCHANNTSALSGVHSAGAVIKYYPDSTMTQNVTTDGQMLLYPVVDQYAGVMRFYFFPVIPAGTGYGLLFKDIDLSFYIDDDGVWTVDNNFCDHIATGGLPSSFSPTISKCAVYAADGGDGNTYIHFHFDLYMQSPQSATIANDGSFYITIGTYNYNEQQDSPLVKRSIVFSNLPLYFNGLGIGNVSLQTSASDSLLEQNNQLLQDISGKLDEFQDDEQQKYENQSEDVQNQLEDESAASEQQGQTLIAMLTQFFTAIRDAPSSDNTCTIRPSLYPYNNNLPVNYQVNLCQPQVKSFLTAVSPSSPASGVSYTSLWSIISSVIFCVVIIGLVSPTLNLIKKTYEELRK